MATYYVDPAATGADSGASWANAWTTLKRAIDGTGGTKPVAGDVVLCRGIQTVSTTIVSNGNAGTITGGHVIFRGVNASGTNDGTRFVLDGANNTLTAILDLVSDLVGWENIEIKRCAGSGSNGNGIRVAGYIGCDENYLLNCYIHDNSRDGINQGSNSGNSLTILNSRVENNGNIGISGCNGAAIIGSKIASNTGGGLTTMTFNAAINVVLDSLVSSNGANGITMSQQSRAVVYGCTMDNNTTDAIETNNYMHYVGACRMTNNANGIDVNAVTIVGYCYMPGSGQPRANSTANIDTAGAPYVDLTMGGTSTNTLTGTDASGGYTSPTSNYNLTSTSTKRNQQIDLDGTTSVYVSAGLQPVDLTASGAIIIVGDD